MLSWVSFWINHEATSARVALGKFLRIEKTWMNYCEICLRRHGAKKNQATSQKSLGYLTTLASQSVELFGQEDKNSYSGAHISWHKCIFNPFLS